MAATTLARCPVCGWTGFVHSWNNPVVRLCCSSAALVGRHMRYNLAYVRHLNAFQNSSSETLYIQRVAVLCTWHLSVRSFYFPLGERLEPDACSKACRSCVVLQSDCHCGMQALASSPLVSMSNPVLSTFPLMVIPSPALSCCPVLVISEKPNVYKSSHFLLPTIHCVKVEQDWP